MTPIAPGKVLAAWNLSPKHHFGQNFLCNPEITERIAERVVQGQVGTVIEIGAGLGALTQPLLQRAGRVLAIERDRDLIPILHDVFSDAVSASRLVILEQDAKTAAYAELFASEAPPYFMAGNLPYQLTGPLLRRTVELAPLIERAVFMVQLEVAARLCALPNTADYGALSIFCQACFAIQKLWTIRPGSFFPQPRVDSAVVELVPLRPPIAFETPLFRSVVQAAFRQRRKKLRNSWGDLPGIAPGALEAAAARSGIDLNARGETLDVRAFARMAQELGEC
jgi:16S rRNA (adenine1518-N6/adenine1519-N6)-dimethyltransferase